MKRSTLLVLALVGSLEIAGAQKQTKPAAPQPAPPPPPPPVVSAQAEAAPAGAGYAYEQRPAGGRPYLVTPEQAQSVIAKFKEIHAKTSPPRVLLFVNRELIDEESGVKLSTRSETVESTRSRTANGGTNAAPAQSSVESEKNTHTNTYRIRDRKEASLTDRQTNRDVERLFGRPLRMGGASIVDQRIASQLLHAKPLESLTATGESDQARKDREAISKAADIVIEILITSRNQAVPEISGDRTITVPDIQATAVRWSDAKILGQATSADLLGRVGRNVRFFDVREITEATALALMEDMCL